MTVTSGRDAACAGRGSKAEMSTMIILKRTIRDAQSTNLFSLVATIVNMPKTKSKNVALWEAAVLCTKMFRIGLITR